MRKIKRAVDIVLGAILLVLFAPVMGLIALIIWLDDSTPILHRPTRIGKDGGPFRLYKFRTMVVGAEAMLAELAHLNLGQGMMIKIPNDPRVTRAGGILRRYSLDELPQLWNVLKGDMSLVGPRPQAPDEIARYTPAQRERLSVLPGITGLWQVSARAEPSFEVWVSYDLQYIRTWSLWLDFVILLKTVGVVLAGKDAAPKPEVQCESAQAGKQKE
jgi:lipopolysaccharide/colanic/teichoic acid biosynthesis glycosyltransferase